MSANFLKTSKFHFVGIGGIGMCGLAELLHNMGATVSGSDLSENKQTQHLKSIGVHIFQGQAFDNVGDVDVVVYSSAVKDDNPEIQAAREKGIPVIRRAEALGEIMFLKRGIAIAGTHGKTTTTSLTASVLIHGNLDPTAVVGGRLDIFKSTAKLGGGDWLVAEADESDGSFLRLDPEIIVITNIDSDHLDHYGNFENLKNAFFDFASSIPFYGSVIVCGDDLNLKGMVASFPKKMVTYGFDGACDYQTKQTASGTYELSYQGEFLGTFQLNLPGIHNAQNATAALVVGLQVGLSFEQAKQGIEGFQGVDRRFQFKGKVGEVHVYDDYGHHPTEVKAVLQGFREKFPKNKVRVLFQPHRYSRTQLCWAEFMESFADADEVIVTDVYPAGEAPIEGINGESFSANMNHPCVKFLGKNQLMEHQELLQGLAKGDVLVTLGAGDIYKFGEALLESEGKS